jgi:hypothetical protein
MAFVADLHAVTGSKLSGDRAEADWDVSSPGSDQLGLSFKGDDKGL